MVLRLSSIINGPSCVWPFNLLGFSFIFMNLPFNFMHLEFIVFIYLSIIYGWSLNIGEAFQTLCEFYNYLAILHKSVYG
jgi:hypothetical protein